MHRPRHLQRGLNLKLDTKPSWRNRSHQLRNTVTMSLSSKGLEGLEGGEKQERSPDRVVHALTQQGQKGVEWGGGVGVECKVTGVLG